MATLAPADAPNGGILSDEETQHFLRRHLDHWDRYGYGLWVFRDRADGRFVGRAGLDNSHVGGNDEVELAYALMAEYWGRGLATEMAEGILSVAFERLGMADVVCFTLTTNRASLRVMEKVGFEYERDVVHAGLPHVLYRIIASEWKERGGLGYLSRRGSDDEPGAQYDEAGQNRQDDQDPHRGRRAGP